MSDTVFTKVDYDLQTLMGQIALGTIGLPHRPTRHPHRSRCSRRSPDSSTPAGAA